MPRILHKALAFGTDSPQTYSAQELDPYSTCVRVDESFQSRSPDHPCTSQQRYNTDVSNSPSFANSRSNSPIHFPTPVAQTSESIADAATLQDTEFRLRTLGITKRDSHPSPLTDSSPSCQKPPREKTIFPRFDGLKRYSPSVILENRGSVARDHLASERTFLAYTRTSLALASTGVALVQLFSTTDLNSSQKVLSVTTQGMHRFAKPFGITAVMLGLVVLVIGKFFVANRRSGLTDLYSCPQAYIDIFSSRTLLQTTSFPLPELPSPSSPSSLVPLWL